MHRLESFHFFIIKRAIGGCLQYLFHGAPTATTHSVAKESWEGNDSSVEFRVPFRGEEAGARMYRHLVDFSSLRTVK